MSLQRSVKRSQAWSLPEQTTVQIQGPEVDFAAQAIKLLKNIS